MEEIIIAILACITGKIFILLEKRREWKKKYRRRVVLNPRQLLLMMVMDCLRERNYRLLFSILNPFSLR